MELERNEGFRMAFLISFQGALRDENAYSFWIEGTERFVPFDANTFIKSRVDEWDVDLAMEIYRSGLELEIVIYNEILV